MTKSGINKNSNRSQTSLGQSFPIKNFFLLCIHNLGKGKFPRRNVLALSSMKYSPTHMATRRKENFSSDQAEIDWMIGIFFCCYISMNVYKEGSSDTSSKENLLLVMLLVINWRLGQCTLKKVRQELAFVLRAINI